MTKPRVTVHVSMETGETRVSGICRVGVPAIDWVNLAYPARSTWSPTCRA